MQNNQSTAKLILPGFFSRPQNNNSWPSTLQNSTAWWRKNSCTFFIHFLAAIINADVIDYSFNKLVGQSCKKWRQNCSHRQPVTTVAGHSVHVSHQIRISWRRRQHVWAGKKWLRLKMGPQRHVTYHSFTGEGLAVKREQNWALLFLRATGLMDDFCWGFLWVEMGSNLARHFCRLCKYFVVPSLTAMTTK